MKENFRKKNLVVLYYDGTGTYVKVVGAVEAEKERRDFSVNTKNYSWIFDGEIYVIGEMMRRCESSNRSGIIGVYDHTKIRHLNLMIWHARKAIE